MMRTRLAALTTLALAAACGEGPSAPPSDVPARLTYSSAASDSVPVFTASGDSVRAAFAATLSDCFDYSAAAGFADGALVLTVQENEASRACTNSARVAGLRLAAGPVNRGAYTAILRRRTSRRSGVVTAYEIGRASVTLQ